VIHEWEGYGYIQKCVVREQERKRGEEKNELKDG
jgi:hypothetical protein